MTSIELKFDNFCGCCCSVGDSCLTLCDPIDCSMPGFPDNFYINFKRKNQKLNIRYVLWTSVVPEPSVMSNFYQGSLAQNPLSGALDLSQTSISLHS